jgi:N,N-dimethylformamidase beta subunit-like protein
MTSGGILSGMSRRSVYTRRAVIGGAAAAGAAVAAVKLAGSPGAARAGAAADTARHRRPDPHPARRRVIAENSLPGDPHWWLSRTGAPDAIMGYAGQASVLPGEPVQLYVSTTSREFRVRAFRMGWYAGDLARRVWESGPVRGHRQRAAVMTAETNTTRADWGVSLAVPTDGWPAGSYLLRLDAHSGAQRYVPVTVRSASTAGKVVIKNAVATWQAYNTWGGYDLYTGPTGEYGDRALAVSLDRPYDQDGAYLFMVYERKLVNLAEHMGLPLAYLTSMDIASDANALDGASTLISPGHDEYWSPSERAHVTAARDAGVNLAFLGANAMFRRTRLAPTELGPDRLVICYKTSYQQDPMYGVHDAQVTSDWRDPPDPRPESSVIGTLYEGFPAVADYVVATPDAWMLAGTGARKGTSFAALVGIEYDRVDPGYPVQRPIQVLSHSPLTCNGVNSYADSAYYTHRGGAGVFNAGTMRWVEAFGAPTYGWGISRECGRFTRRVTANVLRAFADGPAAANYPAHDNLDSMDEWAGDPLASGHNLWPPIVL